METNPTPPVIDRFDGFFFDLDGVLWLDGEPIEGAAALLGRLRERGKHVAFLTNKSTGSREGIRRRMLTAGLGARPDEVINSPYAAACYLRERYGPSRVYAIGSTGLLDELTEQGHTLTDRAASFVVVGFTPTAKLMRKSIETARDLVRGGAALIGCNRDKGNPLPDGSVSLGSFYTVGIFERATGAEATIIGKPHAPIFEIAMSRCGLTPDRCLMIGDMIDSDVRGGRAAGMKTLLVLSGFTNRTVLAASAVRPDYLLESVADLR